MQLLRAGQGPAEVGTDIRAAVSAWGRGNGVLGGVAVFGCTPPAGPRALDAVLVLPRGVIVVVGVDLPEPALALEAPLHAPWTVDGRPMTCTQGGVNPGLQALESSSALARSLQAHNAEPMPVTTVVAVGPFVEQVVQPAADLRRGIRVLHPSTTSLLAAARELATCRHDCSVEPARHLLRVLDERTAKVGVAELAAEGFPDAVAPALASAETVLIPKDAVAGLPDAPGAARPARQARRKRHRLLGALAATVLVVFAVLGFLSLGSVLDPASAPSARNPTMPTDGADSRTRPQPATGPVTALHIP